MSRTTKKISICNDSGYAVVPSSWIEIYPYSEEDHKFVCVIEYPNFPHFVFGCPTIPQNITEEEKRRIIAHCKVASSEVESLSAEAEEELVKDIKIFQIYEDGTVDDYPYGARVYNNVSISQIE